jgi:GT2 family glycosyltransferase
LPSVAIVIPHCNGKEILLRCLESLQHDGYADKRVLLVDNASTDDSVIQARREYPWLEVLSLEKNHGFSGGVNAGIRHADVDIIVLLNNDTVVSPGWLQPLVDTLNNESSVAAVQPKLRSWFQRELFDYAGGAGGEIDRWGYPFCWGRIFTTREKDILQYEEPRNIFWASGSASAWRRSAIVEAGLLDEDFFAHMEEIDLCWRLHMMGYDVRYQPGPEVYHCSGATLGEEAYRKKFLNHRNSWLVLIKNYRWANILKTLPLRLILDLITIPYALVFWGDLKRVLAIIGSWISVLVGLPRWLRSRHEVQRLRRVPDDVIMTKLYPHSIAWQYFFRKVRSTKELPW